MILTCFLYRLWHLHFASDEAPSCIWKAGYELHRNVPAGLLRPLEKHSMEAPILLLPLIPHCCQLRHLINSRTHLTGYISWDKYSQVPGARELKAPKAAYHWCVGINQSTMWCCTCVQCLFQLQACIAQRGPTLLCLEHIQQTWSGIYISCMLVPAYSKCVFAYSLTTYFRFCFCHNWVRAEQPLTNCFSCFLF